MKIRKRPRPELRQRVRPTKWLKQKILETQENCCFACGRPIEDVEFDHVIPLGLGGLNNLDNWAALCSSCHRLKSKQDLKRIAKAKRQRRFHETGRSRGPSTFNPIDGARQRGFDKASRRHVNGLVTPRRLDARNRSTESTEPK